VSGDLGHYDRSGIQKSYQSYTYLCLFQTQQRVLEDVVTRFKRNAETAEAKDMDAAMQKLVEHLHKEFTEHEKKLEDSFKQLNALINERIKERQEVNLLNVVVRLSWQGSVSCLTRTNVNVKAIKVWKSPSRCTILVEMVKRLTTLCCPRTMARH